jgi:4-carboxymuconolactone decarboxylase
MPPQFDQRFDPICGDRDFPSPHARHRLAGTKEEIMAVAPSPAREAVRATVPKMIALSEEVIYGDIWERPGLSKRDRSLIVVASLISQYRPEQLRGHLARALDNGVTKDEIAEIITHLAFYSGWPGSMTAANIAREVFEERGL